MIEPIQQLIDSLREELTQYGQMLVLLDEQQERILNRHTEELLHTTSTVNNQGVVIQAARRRREQLQHDLARTLHSDDEPTLANLAPLLPPDYRPLVTALVQENNHLLTRVQARARQNYLLLRRSLDLLDQFLSTLCPASTPVYNGSGQLHAASPLTMPCYEAVG